MKTFILLTCLLLVSHVVTAQNFQIKEKKGLYGVKNKKKNQVIIPFEYDGIDAIASDYLLSEER